MSTSSSVRPASPSSTAAPPSKQAKLSPTTLQILLDPQHPEAKLPTRGSQFAAGYDLYASETKTIARGGRSIIQTGIRLRVPQDCYGRVAPRSGLAVKHGIDVGAGVVDADYRGLLGVLLFNFGDQDFVVNSGDRIAQLVIEQIRCLEVEEVKVLEESVRGEGGFGSTGGFGPASEKKCAQLINLIRQDLVEKNDIHMEIRK